MEKPQVRPPIGAYARISLDDEGDRLGVERQRKDIASLADKSGWLIHDFYVDNNISAYKRNVRRPEFERLLKDLEDGVIAGIVAYDIDRITRQPVDLERIVELYEVRKGLLFATVQGSIDLSRSDGIFMARTLVNVANKSSADTSRRQKRKNLERAERGLPHGSRRPYGYNADQLTLHATEAPVLYELGMKLLSGMSYKELAYWMNHKGYRTTENKLWYPITVRNTLRRTRYAGFRIHEGVEYKGIWQPIFTRDEWDSLQFLIKERKDRQVQRPSSKKYLLTGFAVCGKCGSFLNGETKRDPASRYGKNAGQQKPLRHIYYCRVQGDARKEAGCGGVVRNSEALDHYIRELICFRLDSDALGSLIASSEDDASLSTLVAERDLLTARKNALIDDYTDGTLTKEELARAKSRLEARLRAISSQLDEIRRSRINVALKPGETVREAWMNNTDGWRRELISTLIDTIVVKVGKTKPFYDVDGKVARFDPNLIEVNWKI